ncbi:MAG TPA: redoxin family protein [Polyangia bacterium]|nr:redoxin family protein [Polyangia bacterium]
MRTLTVAAVLLGFLSLARAASPGDELVGKPALGWDASDWMNSAPLTVEGLRGKVVLVRWFTSKECPYCSVTAPALNQLDADFRARGLVVVGMYHHKDDEHPLDVKKVQGWVGDYGFKFPVAVDRDWRTLRRWWLSGPKRDFTSVSFLIDKKGVVRRVHPGGSMALGTRDYTDMRATIEKLLAE